MSILYVRDKDGQFTQIPIFAGQDSGGNVDYEALENKPKINGVELSGEKSLEDLGIGQPTDEQIGTAVSDYLAEHPEATTTVQDGSINEAKLTESVKRRISRPNCKIIAHRGYWETVPQNTIASFLAAIDNGFDWLEIDINDTADNVLILAHDGSYTMYDNGTPVSVTFSSCNYDDIKHYTWDAEGLYKLNTLQSAFAAMKMHDVKIICDRKGGTNAEILTLAALCGVSDKIMLSYGSPTQALSEKTMLNRYKHIPIRVGVSTYNEMLNLLESVANPVYADTNASTESSYQQKAQICLACHIPMIYAGCTMNRTERWAVLANGIMASSNVSYADLCAAIDIDYDVATTITAPNSVTVATGNTSTIEASSDLPTNAGYVYAYSVNPNIATVEQTVFGSAATIIVHGVANGSTIVRLFTGCGAIVDVPCTVSDNVIEPDEPDVPDIPEVKKYTIVNNLTNVSTSNSATGIDENTAYTATLTAASGYEIDTVTVTMGGVDITATVYNNGTITIASVTGNIVIWASAVSASVEPTVADVVWLYGKKCKSTFVVQSINSYMLVYQETGVLPFTDSTYYPVEIPEGATSVVINCGAFATDNFIYDATGVSLGGFKPASGETYDLSKHTNAKYLGINIKDGTTETIESTTDTSGFSVVFY